MIVTLTANPSVDRTVTLTEPLRRGQVHRAAGVTSHPGGKGVNVARVVAGGGAPTLAVLPGADDDPVVSGLRAAGIAFRTVPVPGAPRTNLTIAETDGTTTKINEPGRPLTARDLDALAALLVELAAGASWIVLSGSLPPGAPVDWYARLVTTLSARGAASNGARIAVDTSDAPLLALFGENAGTAPDLIKPNSDELAQLTGLDPVALEEPSAAAAAAAGLLERGVGAVLATLGAAGAVLVTGEGAWFADAPPIVPRSTVGAGDSALAGYLLAEQSGAPPADRLRSAVAYGSAATALPGTGLPGPADIALDAVTARPLALSDRPSA
ncbi:1-phosphofructokinase family hexose kinase [Nocardia asteroides]|uniref:1-phosphofructokinase family hexose kinase n=1 Tax=Nocardia asteroides TaxID=1824 RepID=UPI001E2D28CD|nr:1-phosphofructokinase family hexose kinase [Nocardia asteroides]UGT57268.1 1-phosphofructokinase family hexose kinase [Nocardia asteroides]